jgi:hypothetical protein
MVMFIVVYSFQSLLVVLCEGRVAYCAIIFVLVIIIAQFTSAVRVSGRAFGH